MADKKNEAVAANVDEAAGVPEALRDEAEALPEKDAVQKAYKRQMLANDVKTEVAAKKVIVQESPDARETPSGAALLKVAGMSDPIEQGEEYARLKRIVRLGSVEDVQ